MSADRPPPSVPETVNDHEMLVQWLRARDARCPVCGYNVRSLVIPRCPECSTRLKLGLEAENAVWGPWALASLSLALGLGFDGVTTILLFTLLAVHPPPPNQLAPATALIGGFTLVSVCCAVGLALVLSRRRAWMRRPRPRQWRWGLAVFGAVGLVHLGFGALVFHNYM
jgi:hypothetical protein